MGSVGHPPAAGLAGRLGRAREGALALGLALMVRTGGGATGWGHSVGKGADAGNLGWSWLQRVQPAQITEGLWAKGRARAVAQSEGECALSDVYGVSKGVAARMRRVPGREGGPRTRVSRCTFVLRLLEGPAASGPRNRSLSGSRAGVDQEKDSGPVG